MSSVAAHTEILAGLLELLVDGNYSCTDTTMQCAIAIQAWHIAELERFPMSRDLYPITCVLCGSEQDGLLCEIVNVSVNEWTLPRWKSAHEREMHRILRESIGGNGIAQVCRDCAIEEKIEHHVWEQQDR